MFVHYASQPSESLKMLTKKHKYCPMFT